MSYIVKTVKQEDNFDIQKLRDILNQIINNKNENVLSHLMKELEEKGYVICKKIKI